MIHTFKLYDDQCTVTYNDNEIINQQIVDVIVEWCKEYKVSDCEDFQNDDPQIYAPDLICSLIKLLKFKTEFL